MTGEGAPLVASRSSGGIRARPPNPVNANPVSQPATDERGAFREPELTDNQVSVVLED